MSNTVAKTRNGSAAGAVASGPLPPHEWDFKNVPDGEIEACYLYEYAREFSKTNEHLQRFKKIWNDPAKEQAGDGFMALHQAQDLLQTHCKNFPLIHYEYFPKIAWLDLTVWPKRAQKKFQNNLRQSLAEHVNDWGKRFRKSRFDRLYITTLRNLEPLNTRPWDILDLLAGKPQQTKLSEIYSLAASKFEFWTFRQAESENSEYGLFHINWNYSDSEIKRAFDEWLHDEREERKKLGLGKSKPVSSRGGFWDRLNWLGALRVKNYYRHKDLVDHADTNIKPDAPYCHYPDLLDAAKKAAKEIDRLFPSQWSENDFLRRQAEKDRNRKNRTLPDLEAML